MMEIRAGETVTVGKAGQVPVHQPEILRTLKKGAKILLGDGDVELRVVTESPTASECYAVSGGDIKSRQGVTSRWSKLR